MTLAEFDKKWNDIDRDSLNDEQEKEFIKDCFSMYEESGFASHYHSKYDDSLIHDGKRFVVTSRCSVEKADCEQHQLPMWNIKFEDGTDFLAFPEEICRIEMKTNTKTDTMKPIPTNSFLYTEEDNRKLICELLNTSDEDEIAEYWNECVDHTNPTKYSKLFLLDKVEMSQLLECLSEKDKDKVIISLCNRHDGFDASQRYFYLTEDNEIKSCNSVWGFMDYDVLYQFIAKYYAVSMYGRKWNIRTNATFDELKDEWFVCEMENGDKIYSNNVMGNLALYSNGKEYTCNI